METSDLSIPELFKIIRYSFRQSEFDEVQDILMDREKRMKMEIQDLKRDLDSTKKDAILLESSQNLAELERLRIGKKLERSESKCEELNEKIVRLREEHKVSCDRAKRADDSHANVNCEKNKSILELNRKINELKSTIAESEQLVVGLRRKQSEADKEVAELKRQNLEATQRLEESRREKMECDSKLENMAQRVMRMEAGLANMLKVKVEDLSTMEDIRDKLAANGEKVDLLDIIKGRKDTLKNDSTNADAENIGTSNFNGSDDTPLVLKGGRKVVHPWTEKDGAVTGRTFGSQVACNSSGVEINDTAKENPVFLGSHATIKCTLGGSRRSSKVTPLPSAASEVIEIGDSDDEGKPGGTLYIPTTSFGKNTRKRSLIELYSSSSESD